eukprot:Gb_31565 [translate_table: standard]
MGNKLTRRRNVVDERYTRPQGLYQHRDVDHKKLRKLILDAKLAPCYPGGEDSTVDLDECPICFLYYPSLNRSRCCMKGICTECFLQMKSPHSARPTQCPFCKTSNYAVEYRGAKTPEEKGIEQAEEQKVIEAKIRIRQQELQAEKEREKQKQEAIRAGRIPASEEFEGQTLSDSNVVSDGDGVHVTQGSSSQPNGAHAAHGSSGVAGTRSQTLHGRHNRDDEFDLDLEDIMVMEAIWLSIQEHGSHRIPGPNSVACDYNSLPRPGFDRPIQASGLEGNHESTISVMADSREVISNSSVTGGLACAIAALAERQVLSVDSAVARQNHQSCQNSMDPGESSMIEGQDVSHHNTTVEELSPSDIHERRVGDLVTDQQEEQVCSEEHKNNTEQESDRGTESHAPESWIEVSLESGRALSPGLREGSRGSMSDWMLDHSSEVVEVGTSFSSSVPSASDLPWEAPDVPQNAELSVDTASFSAQPYVIPESFEEQMMLALAISLAEAQART